MAEQCEAFHFQYRCTRDTGHSEPHRFWLDSGEIIEIPIILPIIIDKMKIKRDQLEQMARDAAKADLEQLTHMHAKDLEQLIVLEDECAQLKRDLAVALDHWEAYCFGSEFDTQRARIDEIRKRALTPSKRKATTDS